MDLARHLKLPTRRLAWLIKGSEQQKAKALPQRWTLAMTLISVVNRRCSLCLVGNLCGSDNFGLTVKLRYRSRK